MAVTLGSSLWAQTSAPPVEVFFNYPVAGPAPGEVAYTGDAISAAAVRMVDEAETSVDLAAYNFDHAPLASALRRAHARGVRVRVVTDIDTRHPSLLSPAPNYFWLAVNDEGLMHHKFLVVDAADPQRAAVMTGSTNFTDANIYRFYNDALLLRSPALATAFTQEFELLWGGAGEAPNARASRSGSDKPRRARTRTQVGDLDVELYFSPNDEVSERIAAEIDGATESLAFQLLVFTYDQIGAAVTRAHDRGVNVFGVLENYDDPSTEYYYLRGQGVAIEGHEPDEVVHHKYGVIDTERGDAATLITGSHNWTYSAETFHDENTLVVTGSALLAELYYRAARDRHCALVGGGSACFGVVSDLAEPAPAAAEYGVALGPNPTRGALTVTSERPFGAYRVVDASGRTVRAALLHETTERVTLDLHGLPAGAYALQPRGDAGWWPGRPFQLTK